ncbi:hypothetical protein F5878DRAFT_398501 [Lentinula raphanica]|uniref:Uncharacterized protein n=1 Tax=Lentinula raphanica TaxID=153919 RepID=A0AA38NZZ7_9AGAR|nr:hypothetical protein F5878DRAFT_398501 [Lentinula raphanica]
MILLHFFFIMFNIQLTIPLIQFSLFSLAINRVNAQITTTRRRSSVGGIVAGVVVACLVLICLLSLCCLAARRRRRMRNNPGYASGGYNTGTGGMPLFGPGGMFPFGGKRNNNNYNNYNQNQNGTAFNPQQQQPGGVGGGFGGGYANNNYNSYPGETGVGGGYDASNQTGVAPPPPYGKEGAGYAPVCRFLFGTATSFPILNLVLSYSHQELHHLHM